MTYLLLTVIMIHKNLTTVATNTDTQINPAISSQCNTPPLSIVDMGDNNLTLITTHNAPDKMTEYFKIVSETNNSGGVCPTQENE